MSRRVARAMAIVVAGALALGGCNGSEDGGEAAGTTTTQLTTSTTTPRVDDAGGTATSTTTTGTGAGTGKATGIAVTLAANRLVVGGNALVFGAPAFQVRSYLERALLDPTKEEAQDCGPGRLTALEWPDLTAYLDETDTLVGWYAHTPTFRTDKGVHVASTRTEVEAAYPNAQISESSLGTELWVPLEGQGDAAGLSGLFDGDGATAKLTAVWSGATCVAR